MVRNATAYQLFMKHGVLPVMPMMTRQNMKPEAEEREEEVPLHTYGRAHAACMREP